MSSSNKKRSHNEYSSSADSADAATKVYGSDEEEEEDEEHTMQVCAGCDRAICLACHELEDGSEPALLPCECCGPSSQYEYEEQDEFCVDCRCSCKFCSSLCCPNCSQQCGHCGIVLCPKDSKFAVECWNCHVPYCLVCLASLSSNKSSSNHSNGGCCPQCHAKPSKKMSQLVHLRLKSIYRAFQQQQESDNQTITDDAATSTIAHTPSSNIPGPRKGSSIVMKRNAQGTWDVEETNESGSTTKQSLDEWQNRNQGCTTPAAVSGGASNSNSLQQQQEEADAAAAELLKEIEQEELLKAVKKNTKKRKKTKKKKKDQAASSVVPETQSGGTLQTERDQKEQSTIVRRNILEERPLSPPPSPADNEGEDSPKWQEESRPSEEPSEEEAQLSQLMADRNISGVEQFLLGLKGVPGKAGLRKNARKALKRLVSEEKDYNNDDAQQEDQTQQELRQQRLIQVVSRSPTSKSSMRAECVLHMSPALVGWVIGKGGVRIRDLMEDTGTRIWIDQESMGPKKPRVVYVSGSKRSAVDSAVHSLMELVASAPGHSSSTLATAEDNEEGDGLPAAPASKQLHSKEIITCEPRFVPLLIGRRGWTIKNIQDSSGARVDIDQSVTPRRISISGKSAAVQAAARMVRDVLSYPHAQLQAVGGLEAEPLTAFPTETQALQSRHEPASTEPLKTERISRRDENEDIPIALEDNMVPSRNHTPPPSSLIMSSDIRSIVSASSSLSSTPDPSLSRKCHSRHTPLSEMSADAVSSPALPDSMNSHEVGKSVGLLGQNSYGKLASTAQGALPRGGLKLGPSVQPLHSSLQDPLPTSSQERTVANAGLERGDLYWRHLPLGGIQEGSGSGLHAHQPPPPPHIVDISPQMMPYSIPQKTAPVTQESSFHLFSQSDPLQLNQSNLKTPFHRQSSSPEPAQPSTRRTSPFFQGTEGTNGNEGVERSWGGSTSLDPFALDSKRLPNLYPDGIATLTTDSQDRRLPLTDYQPSTIMSPGNGWLDQLYYPNAESCGTQSLNNRNSSLVCEAVQNPLGAGLDHSQQNLPGISLNGCDDSKLVDRLFGPVGTGDQNLLTGLQSLSLATSSLENVEHKRNWGNSIPGWGGEQGAQRPGLHQERPEHSRSDTRLKERDNQL